MAISAKALKNRNTDVAQIQQLVSAAVGLNAQRGDQVARLHSEGRVDAVEHTDAGTRVKARVPVAIAAALQPYTTA